MALRWIIIILCVVVISALCVVAGDGYKVRYITGDSMGEHYDDVVLVDSTVTWEELDNGDIISFKNECGESVHHRLVYNNYNNTWFTSGDNNRVYDIGKCYKNPIRDTEDFEDKIIGKKIAGFKLPFF
jgi:signal peptidase I